jgi:hypothetical protein
VKPRTSRSAIDSPGWSASTVLLLIRCLIVVVPFHGPNGEKWLAKGDKT